MRTKKWYWEMLILVIFITGQLFILNAGNVGNINPYSFLIGNSAVDENQNIYSINPASIGLLNMPILVQNFSINRNTENILFSQNLKFNLFNSHSILLGYSLTDQTVTLKNSLFRLGYAFNLWNFLYLGANFSYQDKNYKKFHKKNLKTDLGMLISLKIDDIIKFINFGIYGLDANIEKISFKLPNTNYGKNSSLGFSIGLGITEHLDIILSADSELVRNNKILSKNEKIYKYGTQINIINSIPNLSLLGTAEYFRNRNISFTAGAKIGLGFMSLTYGNSYSYITKENKQYLSVAFKLFNNDSGKKVQPVKREIKIHYYQEGNNFKILFKGNRDDIIFWHLFIMDENGIVLKEMKAKDVLPEYIIWDGKDSNGKEVPKGIYRVKLLYVRDGLLLRILNEEKDIHKGIL